MLISDAGAAGRDQRMLRDDLAGERLEHLYAEQGLATDEMGGPEPDEQATDMMG